MLKGVSTHMKSRMACNDDWITGSLRRCEGRDARGGANSVARAEGDSGDETKDLSQTNPCLKRGSSETPSAALRFNWRVPVATTSRALRMAASSCCSCLLLLQSLVESCKTLSFVSSSVRPITLAALIVLTIMTAQIHFTTAKIPVAADCLRLLPRALLRAR